MKARNKKRVIGNNQNGCNRVRMAAQGQKVVNFQVNFCKFEKNAYLCTRNETETGIVLWQTMCINHVVNRTEKVGCQKKDEVS